ncbi:hypothetical protein NT6N_25780 [Oceaniferula spumae]|uniref:Uncharacterized protein n=1 Tax=Oceaniferula spumae TaxID=2979115 RepID=A0AAT9FNI6_9BACT
MKSLLILFLTLATAGAQLIVDVDAFGKELGGWNSKGKKASDYTMSDVQYRTFKPVITETPGGGRFISLRIDNLRGFFSSDDHALLQVSVNGKGELVSLESSIHSQGKSVKSDVVMGTGKNIASMMKGDVILNAGLSLAKDLSAKISGEKNAEAGRVIYPAVIVHNYNKLMKSIRFVPPPSKAKVVSEKPAQTKVHVKHKVEAKPGAVEKPKPEEKQETSGQ